MNIWGQDEKEKKRVYFFFFFSFFFLLKTEDIGLVNCEDFENQLVVCFLLFGECLQGCQIRYIGDILKHFSILWQYYRRDFYLLIICRYFNIGKCKLSEGTREFGLHGIKFLEISEIWFF